jgi:tRNA-dihydrouridine synthase B
MNTIFSLAPLQGITDFTFRRLICKHFSGIHKVYTPFLRLQNDKSLKKAQITDVLPENTVGTKVIPQILCNNAEDFIFLGNYLADLGYQEMNWNLGCPYPMVAKRKLGSGLLPYPEIVCEILEKSLPKIQCKVSIKLRSGYESENDIFSLLPIFSQFPVSELIIHPRIAKQMYKGLANMTTFEKALQVYQGNLAYNGDIQDIESYTELKNKFETVLHWMIGRALITNPFLAEELILLKKVDPETKRIRFAEFYYELFEVYKNTLSGPGHLLNKMQHLWEYFSGSFTNNRKIWKLIKKTKSSTKYNDVVNSVLRNEQFL